MKELETIKEKSPEIFRHLIGLIKALYKLLTQERRKDEV